MALPDWTGHIWKYICMCIYMYACNNSEKGSLECEGEQGGVYGTVLREF